jgi:hypothetical protein
MSLGADAGGGTSQVTCGWRSDYLIYYCRPHVTNGLSYKINLKATVARASQSIFEIITIVKSYTTCLRHNITDDALCCAELHARKSWKKYWLMDSLLPQEV